MEFKFTWAMYTAARDSGKAPNLAGLITSAREPFSMYSRMMERCVLVLKDPMYFTIFLWRRFLRRSISPTMACRLSDAIPARDICLMATTSPVCVSVALNTCRQQTCLGAYNSFRGSSVVHRDDQVIVPCCWGMQHVNALGIAGQFKLVSASRE